MNINDLTCVQNIGDIYIKRDDFFDFFGVCGGKARSALQLIQNGISKGYKSFCTAGSRMSPQCEIVSFICEQFKVECHLFMPQGFNTSVINNISKNIFLLEWNVKKTLRLQSIKFAIFQKMLKELLFLVVVECL